MSKMTVVVADKMTEAQRRRTWDKGTELQAEADRLIARAAELQDESIRLRAEGARLKAAAAKLPE